jgi:uncharacterized protein YdhG (YjbR/CyaY superfamily)
MPTYQRHGNVVHFAMHKNHLGFYPGENAMRHFQRKLEKYKTSKGAVQFPLKGEIPLGLIDEMTCFSRDENQKAWETKQKR